MIWSPNVLLLGVSEARVNCNEGLKLRGYLVNQQVGSSQGLVGELLILRPFRTTAWV